MLLQEGMIAKSVAGHDKDRFYLILKLNSGKALIADGKRRKVEKPKEKSFKHLRGTNETVDVALYKSNPKIRRLLKPFNDGLAGNAD